MNLVGKAAARLTRKPRLEWLWIIAKDLSFPLQRYEARIPFKFEALPADAGVVKARIAHLPEIHRDNVDGRIADGHVCTVARQEDEDIFVAWIGIGCAYSYLLDREFPLARDEAYMYSAYTLPRYRGNGLHPAMNVARMCWLVDHGFRTAIGFIEPDNSASNKMPSKVGYKRVGITGFIELAGVRFYFHRDEGCFKAIERRSYWRKM